MSVATVKIATQKKKAREAAAAQAQGRSHGSSAKVHNEVDKALAEAEEEEPVTEGFWKYQKATKAFYTDVRIEILVAGLIAANFLTNIVEKQVGELTSMGC